MLVTTLWCIEGVSSPHGNVDAPQQVSSSMQHEGHALVPPAWCMCMSIYTRNLKVRDVLREQIIRGFGSLERSGLVRQTRERTGNIA